MDVTPLIKTDRQIIQAYEPGRFLVSGRYYDGPLLVFPDHAVIWPVREQVFKMPETLVPADFAALLKHQTAMDLVLVGTGAEMQFMPRLQKKLRADGLATEIMDTGAACRTYNVLMSEGRRVAAALLPVMAADQDPAPV